MQENAGAGVTLPNTKDQTVSRLGNTNVNS